MSDPVSAEKPKDSMPDFKVAAAQIASVRGDIEQNIATHAAAIASAARHDVSVLTFPELSLIGYEPDVAEASAIEPTDGRLAPLQALARRSRIDVVVGAALRNGTPKPSLGAILFRADGATQTYAKITLGGTEPTYFAPGSAPLTFTLHGRTIGLAICADSSQPSMPEEHAAAGATIYAASVFLNDEWYATDMPRLPRYAARHRMLVVMANHAASIGTLTSVGKSAVWAPDGALLAQARGTERCLVVATSSQGSWRAEVVGL